MVSKFVTVCSFFKNFVDFFFLLVLLDLGTDD